MKQQKQNKKTDSSKALVQVSRSNERLAQLALRSSLGSLSKRMGSSMPTKSGTFIITDKLTRGPFTAITGSMAQQITLTLSNIINASLLTAYTTLFEECRILRVEARVINTGAYQFGGYHALYIDRDPADAIVANTGAASCEPESLYGHYVDKLPLVWLPRDPLEREYQLVPSFSAVASFNYLANSTSSTDNFLAYIHFTSVIEWRGRDF